MTETLAIARTMRGDGEPVDRGLGHPDEFLGRNSPLIRNSRRQIKILCLIGLPESPKTEKQEHCWIAILIAQS